MPFLFAKAKTNSEGAVLGALFALPDLPSGIADFLWMPRRNERMRRGIPAIPDCGMAHSQTRGVANLKQTDADKPRGSGTSRSLGAPRAPLLLRLFRSASCDGDLLPPLLAVEPRSLSFANGQVCQFLLQFEIIVKSLGIQETFVHGLLHGTSRLSLVFAVSETAPPCKFLHVVKSSGQSVLVIPHGELAHSRSVDHHTSRGKHKKLSPTGGVTSLPVIVTHRGHSQTFCSQ
jgi:hypothetical protein